MDKGKIFHSIITMVMTVGLSYFGYEKYEQVQAERASSTTITIEAPVAVESHSHSPVVNRIEIETLINRALAIQHSKDVAVFKQKEPWDN